MTFLGFLAVGLYFLRKSLDTVGPNGETEKEIQSDRWESNMLPAGVMTIVSSFRAPIDPIMVS